MAIYSISGPVADPIQVAHDVAWKTPEWTWAFAFKSLDGTYTTKLFSTAFDGNGTVAGVCFELVTGIIHIDLNGAQLPIFDSRDEAWHYYAACFDATDLRCYTDGVLRTAQGFPITTLGAMVWDTLPLTIMAVNNTALRMAQMRLFDRKLDITEVNVLALGQEVTLGLVARWPATEGTGTTLNDDVGGFDATTAGVIDWSTDLPVITTGGGAGRAGFSSPLVGSSRLIRGTDR